MARHGLPLNRKQVQPGSITCNDTWKACTGVAANGCPAVLSVTGKESTEKRDLTCGLEGFWGTKNGILHQKEGSIGVNCLIIPLNMSGGTAVAQNRNRKMRGLRLN